MGKIHNNMYKAEDLKHVIYNTPEIVVLKLSDNLQKITAEI